MAMGKPIIHGVEGESKKIIEDAGCGICIPPENHGKLAEAVLSLKNDPQLCKKLAASGNAYVKKHYDRERLAQTYLNTLKQVNCI